MDLQSLRAGLRGALLQPGDAGYDAARRVWNGMIDRQPALIARCAGAADVIAAVAFARANDLLVSVRGGGHNVTGNAVCDGGLMIDLSPMKGIRVDPARAHGAGPGRRDLGRARPRDAGVRPGHDRRPDLHDRHRRPHPRRRPRLADAQVRPRRRQPALGRRRHRRRAVPHRQRRPSTPTCSGGCAAAAATSGS